MKPKISIIIPTYNDITYLEKTINSILDQKYPKDKYEILIVDGSTNNLVGELYIRKFGKIKEMRYIKKKGCNLPEALNIGIKNMRGRFFKQLDADDLLTENSLNRYEKYIDQNPEFMVFYSDVKLIDDRDNFLGERREKSYEGKELARRIWSGGISYPSSYIINSKCFKMVGLFNQNETMSEDWVWRIRAIFINNLKFYHIPESLVCYRIHQNQKSTSELRTNSLYVLKMKRRLIREIRMKTEDKELLNILKLSYAKGLTSLIKRNIEVTLKLDNNKIYRKFIGRLEDKVGGV